MPMSSTCRNCGLGKDAAYYEENYCQLCESEIKEAEEYAIKENLDIGAARRVALARRAHSAHNNHADPRTGFQRIQSEDFMKRLDKEPGAADDPRRSGR